MKATVIIPGGRIVRDVTAVYGEDKAKRSLFTVAVNSFYKTDGEKKQKADFIPCIAWGNQATLLENYGKKGRLVAIRGTLETYQKKADENGKYEPVKVFVRVSEIEFLAYEKSVQDKTETKPATTAATTAATTTAAPTADQVAAAMLKLMNKDKTADAGIDLADII